MIRRTFIVSIAVTALFFSGFAGNISHAQSYTICTGNPNSCTGGTTCRFFPRNVIDKTSTDTSSVGYCLLDTEYNVIMTGINAGAAGTNSGSPAAGIGTNSGSAVEKLDNPLKYSDLNSLLTAVLKALIQIGSILLTLAIVWVGFRFVAARGNEEAIRSARTALMWTVIGGLILLGATAIQAVISSTVGAITS